MSSITTPIPTGPIPTWCVKSPWFGPPPNNRQQCANSTLNQTPSDFETICCDGDIIDSKFDLFRSGCGKSLDLNDLYCCQFKGPQQGGLGPIDTNAQTMCAMGQRPMPLASLAATNSNNVRDFLVTYTSASFGASTTGDFIPTQTPKCLWMYTASNAVRLVNVTVAGNGMSSLSEDCMGYTCRSTSPSTPTLSATRTTATTNQSRSSSAGAAATISSSGSGTGLVGSQTLLSLLSSVLLFPFLQNI